MRVIKEKIAAGGKELPPAARRGASASTKVVDIVALLQESLKQHSGKGRAQPKPRREWGEIPCRRHGT
jgi:non-homologous end joining protein Ku